MLLENKDTYLKQAKRMGKKDKMEGRKKRRKGIIKLKNKMKNKTDHLTLKKIMHFPNTRVHMNQLKC